MALVYSPREAEVLVRARELADEHFPKGCECPTCARQINAAITAAAALDIELDKLLQKVAHTRQMRQRAIDQVKKLAARQAGRRAPAQAAQAADKLTPPPGGWTTERARGPLPSGSRSSSGRARLAGLDGAAPGRYASPARPRWNSFPGRVSAG